MTRIPLALLPLALAFSGLASPHAFAKEGDEQGQARKEMKAGNIMRIRDIEKRVLPTMGNAEYLGFAYDPAALAYRLKFIREGRVTYVDVDARTGRVINRSR
ncbi:MAG: hypothetical protein EP350_04000 [Alphaproteobacteria bacterium]|nr:MAG: hypothetical protein EP350_04000 [Alphaproteobacteria bacterium]